MTQEARSKSEFKQAANAFEDLSSVMQGASPFSFGAVLEMQRKNIQAMTEINQRVAQGWQALAQRQADMVSQMLVDHSGLARETFGEGQPQEKMTRQADMLKATYERSLAHTRELGEIVRSCSADMAEVLTQRIAGSISDIRKTRETS